jgi:hypothetical protein
MLFVTVEAVHSGALKPYRDHVQTSALAILSAASAHRHC